MPMSSLSDKFDFSALSPEQKGQMLINTLSGSPQDFSTPRALALIEQGADLSVEVFGSTALMLSMFQPDRVVFNALLEHGVNINQATSKGETALMVAVQKFPASDIEALIKVGADLNYVNATGMTAVLCAVLMRAKDEDGIKGVKVLIDAGVDVNARYKETVLTPLTLAHATKELEVCLLLIEAGADTRIKEDGKASIYEKLQKDDSGFGRTLLKAIQDRDAKCIKKDFQRGLKKPITTRAVKLKKPSP
jgi:ankyrin repeat protein